MVQPTVILLQKKIFPSSIHLSASEAGGRAAGSSRFERVCVDGRTARMSMSSVRLVVLMWTGVVLCWVPLAWAAGLTRQDDGVLLEDELDNQENILTQLLGDYDKVKTLSEGPDCRCKCVVRPLSRASCRRIEDGLENLDDSYTVETVTGPNCKRCACLAPPSALNPCEGQFRLKKLQDASKDVKISTIMDLLEGALYGMDLLKLHSVTTKLLERVENIEKSVTKNVSNKHGSVEEEKEEEVEKKEEEEEHLQNLYLEQKKKHLDEFKPSLQNKVAAAFSHTEEKYEEKFVGSSRNSGSFQNRIPSEEKQIKPGVNSGMSIRTVTFYKADTDEDQNEDQNEETLSGDAPVDLLIDDQTPGQTVLSTPTTRPRTTQQPESWTTQRITTISDTPAPSTSTTGIATPSISHPPQHTRKHKSRLTWDEESTVSTAAPKNPGVCKDTLASIGEPVIHNTYGNHDGAWMKDPKGNGDVIYVTNHHYGSSLLEFRDLELFKQGRASNSYKLPYSYMGTGHVIYSGALYYNRAFSNDIIKYELRLRYVPAWTTLHDAILQHEDKESAWSVRSDVDLAVDESGLWVVYPALDEEGFHREVIVLSKLNAFDLQPERTWRTGLRRNAFGNSFLICGVLYAVDGNENANATVSYAFDTHTHTHMVPQLPFVIGHARTAQVDYNPRERALYVWVQGRQVTYGVLFAY